MAIVLTARERRFLALCVVVVVAVRVATLGAYPLMDTTESRYAEIARKMLETGDWLTPQFDYGVPFWGKPPLSTWLSAAAMAAFGVNEFAARLPSLLLLLCCGGLVGALATLRGGRDQALWTLALFASTALVFVAAGGVMTDPALALGTTLAMGGFWIAVDGPDRHRRTAGLAFFAGIAIGLLAKGPVAAILTFAPIAGWTLWTRRWRAVATRLPWISGSALAAAAVVPWYWAAETRTPGFLEYFLVGEHWRRFVETGWKGDLYGAAHARPRGTIWLYAFAAMLPWSIPALAWLGRAVATRSDGAKSLGGDPWRAYLLLWTLTPMLFFTLAGNILWTYVLPGLPAFTLLVGELWRPDGAGGAPRGQELRPAVRQALVTAALFPTIFAIGTLLAQGGFAAAPSRKLQQWVEAELSQKALVRDYLRLRVEPQSRLVYFRERPHSAEFYSRGKARKAADAAALRAYLDDTTPDFYAIRERDLAALPEADRARLERAGAYGEYRLLRELPR